MNTFHKRLLYKQGTYSQEGEVYFVSATECHKLFCCAFCAGQIPSAFVEVMTTHIV
jgi:hypothetical protein